MHSQFAAPFEISRSREEWEYMALESMRYLQSADPENFNRVFSEICNEYLDENGNVPDIQNPAFHFSMNYDQPHSAEYYIFSGSLNIWDFLDEKLSKANLAADLCVIPRDKNIELGLGIWSKNSRPILSNIRDVEGPE